MFAAFEGPPEVEHSRQGGTSFEGLLGSNKLGGTQGGGPVGSLLEVRFVISIPEA